MQHCVLVCLSCCLPSAAELPGQSVYMNGTTGQEVNKEQLLGRSLQLTSLLQVKVFFACAIGSVLHCYPLRSSHMVTVLFGTNVCTVHFVNCSSISCMHYKWTNTFEFKPFLIWQDAWLTYLGMCSWLYTSSASLYVHGLCSHIVMQLVLHKM